MRYRYYTDDDHEIVAKWWKAWDWPVIPSVGLPQTEPRGVVVSNGDIDVCAGFLYKTDSCSCWMENIVSNKEAPKELRVGSIEFLIDTLVAEGRDLGFLTMMTSLRHKGLIKKCLASGFSEDYEIGMSNLARIL